MHVAIIPARGGSKRIPDKNIREFAGLPMIAHTIRAAQHSRLFERIIVSTDSAKIAEIAKQHGAEAPFLRPSVLACDHTATIPVLLHAEEYCQTADLSADYYCCLYATNPLLQIASLKEGFQKLQQSQNKSFAISVVAYDYPVMRGFTIDENDHIQMLFPKSYDQRSQDLPKVYHDAAQFYWWRAGQLTEQSRFFSEHTIPVELSSQHVQDIDTEIDWQLAEMKFQLLAPKEAHE